MVTIIKQIKEHFTRSNNNTFSPASVGFQESLRLSKINALPNTSYTRSEPTPEVDFSRQSYVAQPVRGNVDLTQRVSTPENLTEVTVTEPIVSQSKPDAAYVKPVESVKPVAQSQAETYSDSDDKVDHVPMYRRVFNSGRQKALAAILTGTILLGPFVDSLYARGSSPVRGRTSSARVIKIDDSIPVPSGMSSYKSIRSSAPTVLEEEIAHTIFPKPIIASAPQVKSKYGGVLEPVKEVKEDIVVPSGMVSYESKKSTVPTSLEEKIKPVEPKDDLVPVPSGMASYKKESKPDPDAIAVPSGMKSYAKVEKRKGWFRRGFSQYRENVNEYGDHVRKDRLRDRVKSRFVQSGRLLKNIFSKNTLSGEKKRVLDYIPVGNVVRAGTNLVVGLPTDGGLRAIGKISGKNKHNVPEDIASGVVYHVTRVLRGQDYGTGADADVFYPGNFTAAKQKLKLQAGDPAVTLEKRIRSNNKLLDGLSKIAYTFPVTSQFVTKNHSRSGDLNRPIVQVIPETLTYGLFAYLLNKAKSGSRKIRDVVKKKGKHGRDGSGDAFDVFDPSDVIVDPETGEVIINR